MKGSPFSKVIARKHSFLLIFLSFLFCFRVGAQFLQRFFELPFLPAFEQWHSGVLPYWVLFISQLLIIFLCIRISFQITTGVASPNSNVGRLCLVFGIVYAFIMLFRLLAGMTFASDHHWFGAILPTLFHLVLASILLVVGHYNLKFGQRIASHE